MYHQLEKKAAFTPRKINKNEQNEERKICGMSVYKHNETLEMSNEQ